MKTSFIDWLERRKGALAKSLPDNAAHAAEKIAEASVAKAMGLNARQLRRKIERAKTHKPRPRKPKPNR